MKPTTVVLGATTVFFGTALYAALSALPGIAHAGYLVGWSERARGLPLSNKDFADRVIRMQRAQSRADALHKQMHKEEEH